MASLIITKEELIELSGYRRAAEQIAWLRQWGIPHFVAADGHPRVIRDALLNFGRPQNNPNGPKLRLA